MGTEVQEKVETGVLLDNNDEIPDKQNGVNKTEYPDVKVKAEPQSSGEKGGIGELVTPNGSRKRKSSSTLLKILNPDQQNDEPSNNDHGLLPRSKKPQPTLTDLLHGFNVSAMQHSIPVDTIDDDVQITHITSPTLFKKGSCSKPTLQKMLTSPYSGKSPLLSSMLKTPKNHSTPSGSRTNSTIDKVFTSSGVTIQTKPSLDNKSLSEVKIQFQIPKSNQARRVDGALTMNKNAMVGSSSTKLTGNHGESALSKLLSTSTCNSGINKNNLPKIPSNFTTRVELHGRENIDAETSRPSLKKDDLEKSVTGMKNIPKELQNDDLINMWTDIITQKVISEFSKDVNATLNSFVKKAIMDSITTSSLATGEAGSQKTDSTNVQQMAGLSQVSSLASSLLSSLAEKVSGCPMPAEVPDNVIESKPPAVRTHDVFNDKNIVKNSSSNIDQNIDKNAWKNSELFGKFSTSTKVTPYTVTKFEGMVKKPRVNVTASLSNQNQSQTIITSTTKMTSNQNDSNKMNMAPTQMILKPVQGADGKYLVYSCNVCGKRFQHHGTLSVHQRTHILESGKSDFKCDICGKVCTAKRYLDIHMRTHLKGQRELVGPKVSCTICGKEFTSEENLIIHKRMHLGEKLYQCDVCHTGFTRNSQLVIHMRIHSGEKPYICNVCGKSFRQSNGLSLHLNVHTDDKPYKCEICGSGFSRKAHYEKHMRKERGERPFKCSECGKGFTDKFNLTMHTRIHQKNKPHVCEICGKGFVQNTHLRVSCVLYMQYSKRHSMIIRQYRYGVFLYEIYLDEAKKQGYCE